LRRLNKICEICVICGSKIDGRCSQRYSFAHESTKLAWLLLSQFIRPAALAWKADLPWVNSKPTT
jgi:hypothetical protein